MPVPSKPKLVLSLIASGAIFVGGAWAASQMPDGKAEIGRAAPPAITASPSQLLAADRRALLVPAGRVVPPAQESEIEKG
jgi:hypothetical protein